jgi:hypothetical protein
MVAKNVGAPEDGVVTRENGGGQHRESKFVAFFSSLPGILTAATGFIVAIGAFVGGTQVVASSPPATRTVTVPGPTVTMTVPAGAVDTGTPSTAGSQSDQPSATGSSFLSDLKTVDSSSIQAFVVGPIQMGPKSYQNSVRFTCNGTGFVAYNVAGQKSLDVTIGVPNDATNAVGNVTRITFTKVGTTTQLAPVVVDTASQTQQTHVDLQGASQVEIACLATNSGGGQVQMDVGLGNAQVSP